MSFYGLKRRNSLFTFRDAIRGPEIIHILN